MAATATATRNRRTNVYIVCAVLFSVAFLCFVLGFSFPAWVVVDNINASDINYGLWQLCEVTVEDCNRLDFDQGGGEQIAVRIVEIFALVMFVVVAVDLLYENLCTTFRGLSLPERLAPAVASLLGGLAGMVGIIIFVADKDIDDVPRADYGWALALVAGSSALALLVSVGFFVSALFLERRLTGEKRNWRGKGQHGHNNGHTPYISSHEEPYQMDYRYQNQRQPHDARSASRPHMNGGGDNLPGFAVYNGMLMQPGHRMSLPTDSRTLPAGRGGGLGPVPPIQTKQSQYYSLSDDRLLDSNFDLSEGFTYLPRRAGPRGASRGGNDNPGYSRDNQQYPTYPGPSEPYDRRSVQVRYQGEDPRNSRVHRAVRPGYNDPYGFDRIGRPGPPAGVAEGHYDRANYGRGPAPLTQGIYAGSRY